MEKVKLLYNKLKSLSDEFFSENEENDDNLLNKEDFCLDESGIIQWLQIFLKNGTENLKLTTSDFNSEKFPFIEFCKYYKFFINNKDAFQSFNDNAFQTFYENTIIVYSLLNPLSSINIDSDNQIKSKNISNNYLLNVDYHYISSDQTIDNFLNLLKNESLNGFTLDLTYDKVDEDTRKNRVYELFVDVKPSLNYENWNNIINKYIPMLIRYYKSKQGINQNYKIGFMLIYNRNPYNNEDFLKGNFLQDNEIKTNFLREYTNLIKVLKFYSIDFKILFYSHVFLSYSAFFINDNIEKQNYSKYLKNQKQMYNEDLKYREQMYKQDLIKQKQNYDNEYEKQKQMYDGHLEILKQKYENDYENKKQKYDHDCKNQKQMYDEGLENQKQMYDEDLKHSKSNNNEEIENIRKIYYVDLENQKKMYDEHIEDKKQKYLQDLENHKQTYKQDLENQKQIYYEYLKNQKQMNDEDLENHMQICKEHLEDQKQKYKQDLENQKQIFKEHLEDLETQQKTQKIMEELHSLKLTIKEKLKSKK